MLNDTTIQRGTNALIYLGNQELTSITVNGVEVGQDKYEIKNRTLILSAELFTEEYNEVVINDQTITVIMVDIDSITIGGKGANLGLIIGLSVGGAVLVAGAVVAIILIKKKKATNSVEKVEQKDEIVEVEDTKENK